VNSKKVRKIKWKNDRKRKREIGRGRGDSEIPGEWIKRERYKERQETGKRNGEKTKEK
jgi:hypothetical protein